MNIFIPEKHHFHLSNPTGVWKQFWDPKKIWLNSILYIFFCAELTHLTGSREAGSLEEACLQMWPDQEFRGGSSRAASKSPINPCPPQKLDCAKSRQAATMSLKNRMSFCFCFFGINWEMANQPRAVASVKSILITAIHFHFRYLRWSVSVYWLTDFKSLSLSLLSIFNSLSLVW